MELLPDLNIPNDEDTVAWNSCHLRWRLGDILKVFLKELKEDFFVLGYLLDPYQSHSEYAHHPSWPFINIVDFVNLIKSSSFSFTF